MRSPIAFVSCYDEAEENAWITALADAMPEETIVSIRAMDEATRSRVSMAIVANPNPADVTLLHNVQWIHSVWAGVERLVAELGEGAPPIVRLIDPQMSRTMAEAVLAWCYYLQRDMPLYRQQQEKKIWRPLAYRPPSSLTVGLLGLGVLGQASAQKLLAADFNVVGWSRSAKDDLDIETFTGENGLNAMLAKSDLIVALLPLTKQTHYLLNKERFAVMKKGAGLINFARGAIIEPQALLDALQQDIIAHAVLDVFINEPISQDCPYWHHPKITVLPHISAPTPLSSAAAIIARNVAHWRQSGAIPATVDMSRGY